MYYVYVLKSLSRDILYKGFTNNLNRRIKEHNKNRCKGTRGKGPWELVYFEEVNDRLEARNREKFLKSGIGREFLENLLK